MSKTLFVSDLDGTLLGNDSKISPESAGLINEAIGNGALFTVATARTPATVSSLLADIRTPLPFIVMTGAAQWNASTGEYSHVVTLPEATASEVLGAIRRHNLPAFIFFLKDNVIQTYHTGMLTAMEKEFIAARSNTPYKKFNIPPDGDSILPSPLEGVLLFYAMQPSANAAATYRDVVAINGCNPIFYHDLFGPETGILEVFAGDATKANAIHRLRMATGAGRVVVFGDNLNDLPMLRAADVAVAVDNAVDEVKEAADIIIGPNYTDSVAHFIHDFPSMLPNPGQIL